MVEELKNIVEKLLVMSDDELMKELPKHIPSLMGHVKELMDAIPNLVPRMIKRLEESDVKRFVKEAPEAAKGFTNLVWEGVSILAEKSPDVKSDMEKLGSVTMNFKATDSPLEVNMKISGGKVTGSWGLAEKADLEFSGSTENIMGLLLGSIDPLRGFMLRKFSMKGGMSLGMKVAPVMSKLAKMARGG
ncbi:MAG: SCP2 sterol-binding domain-containing protein [Candidatus Jordarchaeales archaeon]|nr:SCP2 sterol-binding domain-containing protein [Candidatus Jordarchaeia archaeon]